MSIKLSETMAETRKRCKKMTRRELMVEVNKAIGVARSLHDATQETMKVVRGLQSVEHCYNGMRGEVAFTAKVFHMISDGPIPPTFITHMAQYLELIGE